ncbi:MAG: DNA alkylation repair protein [Thalassotalea sp.]|nr:DNA alkylation repair protein [Thalassotalea sp.]
MLVEQITKQLIQLSDPDIAQHSLRFFKSGKGEYGAGDKFLGLRVPTLRKIVKEYKQAQLEDAIELLKSEFHEIRLCAVFFLVALFERAKSSPQAQEAIVKAYLSNTQYINNWDLVDSSAHKILGKYLLDKERTILYQLAESNDLWEKRISMMATYTFIKEQQFEDTFVIAKVLLNDNHDLIHKIVGWMLREVGNQNKQVEQDFLKVHYKNMPRTMLRYAIEKFSKEERATYLQGKI